jgi:hypothetical protein
MRRGISLFLCVLLFLFSALPTSAARIVYSFAGGAASPRVALTFDDGPHPRYTPQILDILREYGVSATFFSVGSNAENYPDTLLGRHRLYTALSRATRRLTVLARGAMTPLLEK